MEILITAGGTTEDIDGVRSITNTGTGTLAARIAEAFAAHGGVDGIHYVCSMQAQRPELSGQDVGLTVYPVRDVRSLEQTVRDICARQPIAAVIHSMAVSDYRVRAVTTAELVAAEAARGLGGDQAAQASAGTAGSPSAAHIVQEAFARAPDVAEDGKIASSHDNLVILMEKTPKVIALFRELLPEAVIVGFKLLADVPEETLIGTALQLLRKNRCDFVLANDARHLREGRHIGHLVRPDGCYGSFDGKESIARAIAGAVMGTEGA
ncbi:MAG: phosphopantothenate--cysteine ligase [Clostridiales Family XIII bacterium]|jgi:phosphopantothenate-cysteine ligase|nr:phosphopantothenate--cysteine ligase [Clostridiales Family XIII bacterium]